MSKNAQDKDEDRDPTDDADEEAEARENDADEDDADEDDADDDDADDDDADDDDADDDADDDDPDEQDEPAEGTTATPAKDAAARSTKTGASPKAAASSSKPASATKRKGAGAGRAGRAGSAKSPPAKGGGMRNILIYALIIGGIALAFAYLGQQGGGGDAAVPMPEWKDGDVADVAITLVTTDVKDLGCAAEGEVKELHCGFADKRKPHPKGMDARSDDKILQPYTTVDRIQFMAAGMWQTPEMKAKLDAENWSNPSPRFTVDCKYTVAGKMKEALIRWKPENDWLPAPARDWYVGSLTDCKIRQARKAGAAKPKSE